MIRSLLVPDYRMHEVLPVVGILAMATLMCVAVNTAYNCAKTKNEGSNTEYTIPDSILIVTIIWGSDHPALPGDCRVFSLLPSAFS